METRAYKAHTPRASAFNCVDSGAHELPKTFQLQCIIIVVMQFLPGRPLPSFSLSMRSQNVLIVSRCG